jgi:hypothetical protein
MVVVWEFVASKKQGQELANKAGHFGNMVENMPAYCKQGQRSQATHEAKWMKKYQHKPPLRVQFRTIIDSPKS